MGRHGQTWSIDLIIGVLVFMLAVGIIYSLLVGKSKDDVAPLRIESEVIADKLTQDPTLGVADNNQLNLTKLGNLADIDYEALKQQLGIKDEFCVYLRDESGNLTYITDADGNKYTGVGSGSGDLNVSGTPCGCVNGTGICR